MPPRAPAPTETITFCDKCYFANTEANGSLTCHKREPNGSSAGEAIWPAVEATDWCGYGYNATTNKWNTPSGNEPVS
jgi:hypothetical protein